MPRSFRPGLHITTTESRPQYGTQDIWLGTAKAYIKFPEDQPSRLILHEFLAARMANAIGIPVPFGEAASMPDGNMAWASAHIGSNGQEYAPPNIADILASDGDLLAGIAVFDTWIYNPDRTDENLIWHPAIGLWAIDHEASFCGPVLDCVHVLRGMKRSVPTLRVFESEKPTVESLAPWVRRTERLGKEIAARCTNEARQRGFITKAEESGVCVRKVGNRF